MCFNGTVAHKQGPFWFYLNWFGVPQEFDLVILFKVWANNVHSFIRTISTIRSWYNSHVLCSETSRNGNTFFAKHQYQCPVIRPVEPKYLTLTNEKLYCTSTSGSKTMLKPLLALLNNNPSDLFRLWRSKATKTCVGFSH